MQRYLLHASIWAMSIATLAGGFAVYFAPPMLPVPQAAGQARGVITPVAALFGERQLFESQPLVPSDVRVMGVLGRGEQGAVLVSIGNGPVRVISAGKPEPDGWVLHRIDATQIVLGHFGQQVVVNLGSVSPPLSK